MGLWFLLLRLVGKCDMLTTGVVNIVLSFSWMGQVCTSQIQKQILATLSALNCFFFFFSPPNVLAYAFSFGYLFFGHASSQLKSNPH